MKFIENIINSIIYTTHDFSDYLEPTNAELSKMKKCGDCEFNKLVTLDLKGVKYHYNFCHENFYYVKNNQIQLDCDLNKQHLLKNTFWNRLKLQIKKYASKKMYW